MTIDMCKTWALDFGEENMKTLTTVIHKICQVFMSGILA